MSHGRILMSLVALLIGVEAVGAGEIYWANSGNASHPDDNWIQRARIDGSDTEVLVDADLEMPLDVALDVDAGKMYFTDIEADLDGRILRANLDGTGLETLVSGLGAPAYVALDLDVGKVYWTAWGHFGELASVQRANLDGTGVETLVEIDPGTPMGLALDVPGGKMYWCDLHPDNRWIRRANLDGSGVETIIDEDPWHQPVAIALDLVNNRLYWTDNGTSVEGIRRAKLDGTDQTDILTTGIDNAGGIEVDGVGGYLYWTDANMGKLFRANLDGSGVVELVDDLSNPAGLALDVKGDPIPALSEWGVVAMALLVLTAGTLVFARRRQVA